MRSAPLLLLTLFTPLISAADKPAPLMKPVTPRASAVRVRIATSEEEGSFYHVAGQIPKAGGKKDDGINIRVAFEVRPGNAYVSEKKWKSWGYEVPATRIGILPELVLRGVQLAPDPGKGGRAVEVRIPGLRVAIVEPPGDVDTILGCDLLISLSDVTRNTDRAFEPRLYFADRFLELTVPAGSITRPGTGDEPPPDPAVNADATLVPVSAATTRRGVTVFGYAALNGLSRYRTPEGKVVPVSMTVSSTTNCPRGIIMTMGTARGCEVELEEGKDVTGIGSGFQTALARGKVKELRIGVRSGPGQRTARDLVLKDVTVWVDRNDSGHMVWLGPNFFREHLADPVYACAATGAWALHGRVKPERLQDVKTRPKK